MNIIHNKPYRVAGKFLNYWLKTKHSKRYFENNAGGSGQRCTLVLDTIKSIPLKLPELEKQKQIAKVLSALDAKIEVKTKINAELRDWLLPMLMNGQATVRRPEYILDVGEVKEKLRLVAEESGKYKNY